MLGRIAHKHASLGVDWLMANALIVIEKRLRQHGAPPAHHLHARVRVGDVLDLSEPYGDLVLDTDGAETPCCSPPPASV